MEVISESLSLADVYDADIYKGEWERVPYYTAAGIAVPKYYLGELLKPEEIQPGSTWTKYGNYKMRLQKIWTSDQLLTGTTRSFHSVVVFIEHSPPWGNFNG